jgi:hypothetical protein
MKKEIKKWVKFRTPGSFCAEDWNRDVDSFDPSKIVWPDNAYCFQFYTREDVVDGDKRYEGKAESVGPLYYHPESKIETLSQVKANPKAGRCLVGNMECNGWTHIIWSRWGNWPQPFRKGETEVL